MSNFKALINVTPNDIKKDGTTNIKIRITHRRKVNYISTDLFIFPTEMDRVTGQFKGQNQNYLTLKVNEWLSKCIKADMELGGRREFLTVSQIKKYILSINENPENKIDFYEFTDELIAITKKKGTADNFKFLANSLKSFCGDELPFLKINLSFLNNYEIFLTGKTGQTDHLIPE